jgi:hypothetical protein
MRCDSSAAGRGGRRLSSTLLVALAAATATQLAVASPVASPEALVQAIVAYGNTGVDLTVELPALVTSLANTSFPPCSANGTSLGRRPYSSGRLEIRGLPASKGISILDAHMRANLTCSFTDGASLILTDLTMVNLCDTLFTFAPSTSAAPPGMGLVPPEGGPGLPTGFPGGLAPPGAPPGGSMGLPGTGQQAPGPQGQGQGPVPAAAGGALQGAQYLTSDNLGLFNGLISARQGYRGSSTVPCASLPHELY